MAEAKGTAKLSGELSTDFTVDGLARDLAHHRRRIVQLETDLADTNRRLALGREITQELHERLRALEQKFAALGNRGEGIPLSIPRQEAQNSGTAPQDLR